MSGLKQKIDDLLPQEVDRQTFLKQAGLLFLVVFGVSKLLHFDFAALKPKTQSEATVTDNSAGYGQAMAVSAMRI